ncbi:MAG: hypothetical protein VSS75_029460, partial [Candidatus Parabeggiatoa sp.]|nr:hypothetical protein [Candidatus Parabeggiatoa sp.]
LKSYYTDSKNENHLKIKYLKTYVHRVATSSGTVEGVYSHKNCKKLQAPLNHNPVMNWLLLLR